MLKLSHSLLTFQMLLRCQDGYSHCILNSDTMAKIKITILDNFEAHLHVQFPCAHLHVQFSIAYLKYIFTLLRVENAHEFSVVL